MSFSSKPVRAIVFVLLVSAGIVLSSYTGRADDKAEKIPIVGVNKDGASTQALVRKSEYVNRLGGIVDTLHESASKVLPDRGPRQGWTLRTLILGFAVGVEIGIGPILTVGALPEFLLIYSNQMDPLIP